MLRNPDLLLCVVFVLFLSAWTWVWTYGPLAPGQGCDGLC